jgi:predicted membrane-bound spermidine synthase
MTRRKKPGKNFNAGVCITLSAVILIACLTSCESIFGPKTAESSDTTDTSEARIIVDNEYGQTLDIYMDGTLQFTLEDGNTKKIRDVSFDEHEMKAKLAGTSTVVDSQTIDVIAYQDYTYYIDDSPDIDVINQYGVTLKIYMDGNYQFDLQDEEDRWIMNVSMGEHYLKAVKASDNKEVSSTTIDVDENKDYSWTIS